MQNKILGLSDGFADCAKLLIKQLQQISRIKFMPFIVSILDLMRPGYLIFVRVKLVSVSSQTFPSVEEIFSFTVFDLIAGIVHT
jgi:hypothetical protein